MAQLIEGLSLGMRLKTPSLCPKPIGNLIQRQNNLIRSIRKISNSLIRKYFFNSKTIFYTESNQVELTKFQKTENVWHRT